MTPRERILAVMRGDPVDMVPLLIGGFAYRDKTGLANDPDPGKKEISERIIDNTSYFEVVSSNINRYLVTPPQFIKEVKREEKDDCIIITKEIETPKGNLTAITGQNPAASTTWTIKYPVESKEDIEKIRSVPWELPEGLEKFDPKSKGTDFDTRGIIYTNISSPMVCVGGMMTYEYFLELCALDLELVKELSHQCMERILDVVDFLLADRKIEYVWMGGCEWVTPPMASPMVYDELVQTYEKPLIDRIHEGEAIVHIHCHGNVGTTIEKVIERGGDFLEPVEPPPDGDITFAEAKKIAAGRLTLGGNVEARVLENESRDTVEKAARAAFEGGKERMVFKTTAGPINLLTPRMIENYHCLVDVWEELRSF
ncbi:uroporphyrinogen decarboxylase family protein [Planctomycetota bacterium]